MNKEIASIKKRLKTQLEHKHRWLGNLRYATDEQKERYTKEADKCDKIISGLQQEFILAVGKCSVVMNAEAIKAQWDMIVKEIERGL